MNSVLQDGKTWWHRQSGRRESLSYVLSLVAQSPDAGEFFLSAPPGRQDAVTFSEFFSVWFDEESDLYTLREVSRITSICPGQARMFHTAGWIAGLRGMTFSDLLDAAGGVNIDDIGTDISRIEGRTATPAA